MPLKKSELYSSLWQSADALRGGMDASQYKDYVLTLLFVKYVSDKYAGDPRALIIVPEGGSFDDMVRLKGDKEIGDKMNKIIGRLAEANDLRGVIDIADFNDEDKLGRGREMVERLSNLIGIFQGIDLRANRIEGDDLLGDAYEYLMRHFATQSGKSKGQFYTPAEVSRVMAKLLGIGRNTIQDQSVYDPTCGSGSLLLKVADEAPRGLTIYGQEIDNATAALARMNMILHDRATAEIWRGNTLSSPHWTNPDGSLKTFDFVVANPPFSQKNWTTGLDPAHDQYGRFELGVPPAKKGDYAFLLHILKSMKSTGKGAVILPHGVLFRGHAEATIRRNLVRRGYIKGIIGLPPNLFYGTGIPACIIVLDKEQAGTREGIFMIDASRGFMKDGAKNRLRSQDIHKIVDVFTRQETVDRYSRVVPFEEIEDNDYNLNIPRYIDSSEPEDLHDLHAHLNGGVPQRDVDALSEYWEVLPGMRDALFMSNGQPGYLDARYPAHEVKKVILSHPAFEAYASRVRALFDEWKTAHEERLMNLSVGDDPKALIHDLSEDLLERFKRAELVDRYDVYQHLMDYWAETMQDDVYIIAQDGWEAGRELRAAEDKETPDITIKKGRRAIKYVADLIPPRLIIARYFTEQQAELDELEAQVEEAKAALAELEEEHTGDEGVLDGLEGDRGGIAKGNVQDRVMEVKDLIMDAFPSSSKKYWQAKKIKRSSFGSQPWTKGVEDPDELFAELDVLHDYLRLADEESTNKKSVKEAAATLDKVVLAKYAKLTEEEVKELVVRDKWFADVARAVASDIERVTQRLSTRVQALEERYVEPLSRLSNQVNHMHGRVQTHLTSLGVKWQ